MLSHLPCPHLLKHGIVPDDLVDDQNVKHVHAFAGQSRDDVAVRKHGRRQLNPM